MASPEEKPKIIIDEDWKSKAQAEKEALEQKQEAEHEPAARQQQLPPPTLAVLISTLATQALVLMGVYPNPMTGKAEVELEQAKHFIDTLEMLEQKTNGNRTPDESKMLDGILHELRMAYVTISANPQSNAGQ